MIVKISIPLTNYEDTDTFDFDIYFEGDRPPTLEDVIYRCNHEHEEELKLFDIHPERGPYLFEYGQCLEILREFPEKFPNLDGCYSVSIPIPTKFGYRAMSAERIRLFQMNLFCRHFQNKQNPTGWDLGIQNLGEQNDRTGFNRTTGTNSGRYPINS